jgi:hypothetical protein
MRGSVRPRALLVVAVVCLGALCVGAIGAQADTGGPGLAPMPDNPVTYQPLKHICNSRLPVNICQDFTVDIKTGLNGSIVSLLYTQNYFCDFSVKSAAETGCEFGREARHLPPGVASRRNTDPLYLMFPAGDLVNAGTSLQPECQHAGLCTDHPSRIDFSRVLGAGAGNLLLPVHDHFETTRNGNRPEWHNLYAFLVSKRSSWVAADQSHDVKTLFRLARDPGSGVRGPFASNIYFFFQTLPGSPYGMEVDWSKVPSPAVNPPTMYDPSITGPNDALIDHVFKVTDNAMSAFFGKLDIRNYRIAPSS